MTNAVFEDMSVDLIDHMGDDLSVVDSARVSFDKQVNYDVDEYEEIEYGHTLTQIPIVRPEDEKLIRYLARHNHWTPFGHNSITMKFKAPVFVARQLVKHQTGGVWNEVSRRYVDSVPTFYRPDGWRLRADNLKQGSQEKCLEGVPDREQYDIYNEYVEIALDLYQHMLKQKIAPEQARLVLPVSHNTEWYWTGSVAFWSRVCKLRLDSHSQYETRLVAQEIDKHLKKLFPVSWKYLMEHEG